LYKPHRAPRQWHHRSMTVAIFRFYEELNDFLPPRRRKRDFEVQCASGETVGRAIDALGVPRRDVELVLVNARSVDFSYSLGDGDRVSVYPVFEALDVAPLVRVRRKPLREPRFIVDRGLGPLAALLRTAGFDAVHDPSCRNIRRRALVEHRILLTRDRAVLADSRITHRCHVRAPTPRAQLREIVERLHLEPKWGRVNVRIGPRRDERATR
jgi:hypothetical protein